MKNVKATCMPVKAEYDKISLPARKRTLKMEKLIKKWWSPFLIIIFGAVYFYIMFFVF